MNFHEVNAPENSSKQSLAVYTLPCPVFPLPVPALPKLTHSLRFNSID